jgi:hypothetical protein
MRKFFNLENIILSLMGMMFLRPKAYASVATGSTLAQMDVSALVRTMWDSTIEQPEATLDDIHIRDLVNVVPSRNGEINVPVNEIFFQVPTSDDANTIRLQAGRPLVEAPRIGESQRIPGYEENLRMLYADVRYNIVSKGVAMLGYGPAFEDLDATGIYKTVNPIFKKFWAEYRGLSIRKAAMLTYEDCLTAAPTSLAQQFCKNVFVCNIAESDQPTYDTTALTVTDGSADSLAWYPDRTFSGASTFVESIAAKMVEGAGLIDDPVAYLDVAELDRLDTWLTLYVKMPKIRISGEWGYRVDLNPYQYDRLASALSTLGDYFKYTNQFVKGDGKLNYPGLLGMYKNLFLFKDSRGATITLSGSEGSYTLKPGWYCPGDNEDRNLSPWSVTSGSQNLVFDVAMVYGAGGLVERVKRPIKYVNESQEYGYLQGRGSYGLRGIQTLRWDIGTPTASTMIQRAVAMVISSRKAVAALRSTS